MDNLLLLWEYQQADIEYRECEAKIVNTPTRKKLIQLKKFYQGRDNARKYLEENPEVAEEIKNKILACVGNDASEENDENSSEA